MIILTSELQSLTFSISPVSTNNVPVFVSYRETTEFTFLPRREVMDIDGTSTTTLVSGKSATSIGIDYINVYNTDTSTVSGSIYFTNSGTDYTLWNGVINPNERLEYCKSGFVLKNTQGLEKQSIGIDYNKMQSTSAFNLSSISGSVTNTTVTLADVTGLQFPVTANKLYWFRFIMRYQSGSTANGGQFTINGPAFAYLNYNVEASAAAGAIGGVFNINAYDTGLTTANSSNTPNCRAIIDGLIVPTANGNIIARFRSELAGTAITINPGSYVEWEEIYSY